MLSCRRPGSRVTAPAISFRGILRLVRALAPRIMACRFARPPQATSRLFAMRLMLLEAHVEDGRPSLSRRMDSQLLSIAQDRGRPVASPLANRQDDHAYRGRRSAVK